MKQVIVNELLKMVEVYKNALSLYSLKRGTTLSAASTFYLIISLIPLILLLFRFAGLMISDLLLEEKQIILFIQGLFPQTDDLISKGIGSFISSHLLAQAKFSIMNSLFLFFTGFSFLNSIWNGLYILTENKENINIKKYLKGVLILGTTFLLIFSFLVLPTLVHSIFETIRRSLLSQVVASQVPALSELHIAIKTMGVGFFSFYDSILFIGFGLVVYFTIFFKFTFSGVVSYRNSFYGAFTFILGVALLRQFFSMYLNYVRSSMILHYGDYYTVILSLMWVFFLMNIFYFSSCVTHSSQLLRFDGKNKAHIP